MSASAPPPLPDLRMLAGPQLMGFLLAWGLQGALTVQAYLYHLNFKKDTKWLKGLVYFVVAFEWVQTGLITQAAFDVYVYDYGNIQSMVDYHSTWFSVPIMSAVISLTVQWYFCWRIWIFSRSTVLTGTVAFLSFAQAVLGVAAGTTLKVFQIGTTGDSVNRPIVVSGLIIAFVADIMIAVSMTFLLMRSRTGIKQTDDMIQRLVRLGIETGAMTASVALLYAIIFIADQKDLLFQAPALVLPKLYSNTLLVSLNNRAYVQRNPNYTVSSDSNTLSTGSRSQGAFVARPGVVSTDDQWHIDVSRETYVSRDDMKGGGRVPKDTVELDLMKAAGRHHNDLKV